MPAAWTAGSAGGSTMPAAWASWPAMPAAADDDGGIVAVRITAIGITVIGIIIGRAGGVAVAWPIAAVIAWSRHAAAKRRQ